MQAFFCWDKKNLAKKIWLKNHRYSITAVGVLIAQKKELAKKTASSVGEHTVTPTVCVVCNDTARNRREVVNGCSSRQSRNVACNAGCACHPFFPSKHDSSIQYGQLGQCGVRSGSRPREV